MQRVKVAYIYIYIYVYIGVKTYHCHLGVAILIEKKKTIYFSKRGICWKEEIIEKKVVELYKSYQ